MNRTLLVGFWGLLRGQITINRVNSVPRLQSSSGTTLHPRESLLGRLLSGDESLIDLKSLLRPYSLHTEDFRSFL